MIIVTVFLLIMNQMDFCLGYNQKENCHYDHFPYNIKVIRILVIRVQRDMGF